MIYGKTYIPMIFCAQMRGYPARGHLNMLRIRFMEEPENAAALGTNFPGGLQPLDNIRRYEKWREENY